MLRQAQLSTHSFYRHFDTKNDVVLAPLEQQLSGTVLALRRKTAAAANPAEKVCAYVNAAIDMSGPRSGGDAHLTRQWEHPFLCSRIDSLPARSATGAPGP